MKNKTKKYHVISILSHEKYVNDRLKEAQDNGYEIAGDILLYNKDGDCTRTNFLIPMKKLIKE